LRVRPHGSTVPTRAQRIGSVSICRRLADARAKRTSIALRRAAPSGLTPGFPDDRAFEAIGQDQTLVRRQHIAREIAAGSEIEAIAIAEIVLPFAIAQEIRPARLDLDDCDPARMVECHQIGAPAVGERQLAEHRVVAVDQGADHPALDVRSAGPHGPSLIPARNRTFPKPVKMAKRPRPSCHAGSVRGRPMRPKAPTAPPCGPSGHESRRHAR
jgi:hypothetical protein